MVADRFVRLAMIVEKIPGLTPEYLQYIVLGLLSLMAFLQLYYWLLEMSGPAFKAANQKKSDKLPPVSIVICARNELKNLRKLLPSILDQDYPEYQVVVVNDCSWDESQNYLDEMADAYARLKVVTLKEQEKYQHGKKFALTLGIKAATHEYLLLTDADCKPEGRNWIRTMMQGRLYSRERDCGFLWCLYERTRITQ